jgi:hypothetical protein
MQPIDDASAHGAPVDDNPSGSQGKREMPGNPTPEPPPDPAPAPRKPLPDMPPAGPHATPDLTNEDATPGSGYLPQITPEDEADPAGG